MVCTYVHHNNAQSSVFSNLMKWMHNLVVGMEQAYSVILRAMQRSSANSSSNIIMSMETWKAHGIWTEGKT